MPAEPVSPDVLIRPAVAGDLAALVDIFNHYVRHGHVTFDSEPNTVASRRPWFEAYGNGCHQLLVAVAGGAIAGCTYSSRYQPRPAFDATVETSIYLHPAHRRRGPATLALGLALDHLRTLGVPRALLTVEPTNLPSTRVVLAHGGTPDGQGVEPANGHVVNRYWIDLATPRTLIQ